jgi:hypothetical protein
MNLSKFAQWAIRQSMGSKRGDAAIAILSGPIGAIIDMALSGKVSEALSRLDEVTDAVREVIQ